MHAGIVTGGKVRRNCLTPLGALINRDPALWHGLIRLQGAGPDFAQVLVLL